MEVFLSVPLSQSNVQGVTLEFIHLEENIAQDGDPNASNLADEQLIMIVQHDGTNPFCCSEPCNWQFIFVAPTVEDPVAFLLPEDSRVFLECLPFGRKIIGVKVEEGTYDHISGIWVKIFFDNVEEDGSYLGFNLVTYVQDG
jgi:hypothetical protein